MRAFRLAGTNSGTALVISFILPAHNEEALLGRTLSALHESARALGEPYEAIVANDASTDRTGEIADGWRGNAGSDREGEALVGEGRTAHSDLRAACPLSGPRWTRQQTPGIDLELRHGLSRVRVRRFGREPDST